MLRVCNRGEDSINEWVKILSIYANSDRTSDDLVWKIVESIKWDWNVTYLCKIYRRTEKTDRGIRQIERIVKTDKQTIDRGLELWVRICASLYTTIKTKLMKCFHLGKISALAPE